MKNDTFTHVNRIIQKMREDDSETANYALPLCISVTQSRIASHPRPSRLMGLITDVLREHPRASSTEVRGELEKHAGGNIISEITDETIEWFTAEDKVRETPISAIPMMVSRARKYLP